MGIKRQSENYSKAQKARRAKQSKEELSQVGTDLATARWKVATEDERKAVGNILVAARRRKKTQST